MGLKQVARSRVGGLVLAVVSLGIIGWAFVSAWGFVSGPPQPGVWYICTETNKAFKHVPVETDGFLVYSKYSGKDTGMPAELCWWTAEGTVRNEPFPVLLNSRLGKPEPTFCPDCKRLVVPNNPGPGLDLKPPPTQAEYEKLPRRK